MCTPGHLKTCFFKTQGNLHDDDKPTLLFCWGRYLNMKSITTDNGNSHRGFRAGLRKYFDESDENFDTPFSVLLHKDQAKLVESTKGGRTAKNFDNVNRKVFVNVASKIIEANKFKDF